MAFLLTDELKAVFWMNATYKLASQWSQHSKVHTWARRRLKKAVKTLIPMALQSFQESHPEMAGDPLVRYTFYPAVDPQTGYVDITCIGETGLSFEGAMSRIKVGLGLSDSVFRTDYEGNIR